MARGIARERPRHSAGPCLDFFRPPISLSAPLLPIRRFKWRRLRCVFHANVPQASDQRVRGRGFDFFIGDSQRLEVVSTTCRIQVEL
jgi:hypothetical protein